MMDSKYAYAGIIMISVGLFEMLVTPQILRRFWAREQSPNTAYVLRMVRRSGIIVVMMGLAFLVELLSRSI